jgi:hypothetical protein
MISDYKSFEIVSKWRHLLTSPRPGACGEHEVYIWTPALRDHVLGTDGTGSGA